DHRRNDVLDVFSRHGIDQLLSDDWEHIALQEALIITGCSPPTVDAGIGPQPPFCVGSKGGQRRLLLQLKFPQRQLRFKFAPHLFSGPLITNTFGFALTVVVDKDIPLAIFLTNLHSHAYSPSGPT